MAWVDISTTQGDGRNAGSLSVKYNQGKWYYCEYPGCQERSEKVRWYNLNHPRIEVDGVRITVAFLCDDHHRQLEGPTDEVSAALALLAKLEEE